MKIKDKTLAFSENFISTETYPYSWRGLVLINPVPGHCFPLTIVTDHFDNFICSLLYAVLGSLSCFFKNTDSKSLLRRTKRQQRRSVCAYI